jgi:glycosyltransferase involved in cell wall biosynthesis
MRVRRVRIVHVIQNLNYGGMEKLLADVVRRIDRDRFESHVVNLEYAGRYSREMEGNAQVHVCPPMSRLSLLRPAVLARQLAGIAPDIVHTHSGVWYKASRAARMARVPGVVHTEHGKQAEDWRSRFLDRRAARRTDAVIAVSQALGEYLSPRLAIPREAIHVVPNGVDVTRFAPRQPSGALRKELGLTPEQPIIGSIGRLEPVKGYEVVIQAFAALRSDRGHPLPVLVVAGEGSARGELERLASDLHVADRVFLLGWRDDPEDLLAHFQCFVMGSWSEGTSVSLLEAMASGLAPVVTAVGGNPAVLGPELAGQAVSSGDVAGLAAAIERTLDPAHSRNLGARARARVASAFNLDTMVRAYEAVYERLVT